VAGTTLTFSAAPPSGTANISVRFLGIPASGVTTTAYRTLTEFTATAGQTTFTPPSYTVGFLNVYRNGVLLGTADYTASNGTTVVLVNPASAGDLVVTESFYVSSVLNAIPGTAGSVGTAYLVDGSVTTAKIADANVTQAKLASGVAGNGPAFSAYRSGSNQNVSSGTWVKAQLNTEDFDTANAFDSTTNYRFTPLVAGYYQINGSIAPDSTSSFSNGLFAAIYKNNTLYRAAASYNTSAQLASVVFVSALVYLNGSTDYIELYGNFVGGAGMQFSTNYFSTSLSGTLVRTA
jgi:hypothetical protein